MKNIYSKNEPRVFNGAVLPTVLLQFHHGFSRFDEVQIVVPFVSFQNGGHIDED